MIRLSNIFKKKKVEIDYDAETPRSLSSEEFKLILNKYKGKLTPDFTYDGIRATYTYAHNDIPIMKQTTFASISISSVRYTLLQNLRLLDQEDLFDLPENINLSQSDLFQ